MSPPFEASTSGYDEEFGRITLGLEKGNGREAVAQGSLQKQQATAGFGYSRMRGGDGDTIYHADTRRASSPLSLNRTFTNGEFVLCLK